MIPIPRPYQMESIEGVREQFRQGGRRVLLQSPTGSGKSVTAGYMFARAAEQGLTGWLICHRKELLDQLSGTLGDAGVEHSVIAAGHRPRMADFYVATIQTLANRISRGLKIPDLIVIDEAHHSPAASYRKVIDACGESRIVGLTATPERLDGRGLDDLYDSMVLGPSVKWLTEAGFLAPYDAYWPEDPQVEIESIPMRGGDLAKNKLAEVVDQPSIVGNAVEHYVRLVAPSTCLVYCVNRVHARHVRDAYRARGIDARYCGGDTPKDERKAIVAGFRRGDPPVIVSVDLFGEGLDVPGLQAVQLLRHTASVALYLQQVGRVLRPGENKGRAIILDHVRNIERHGPPDMDREWSLHSKRRRGRARAVDQGPPIRRCEECFIVFASAAAQCPNCGWRPPQPEIPDVDESAELTKMDPEVAAARAARKREERQATLDGGFAGLVRLAVDRGYKVGWAAHRWVYREAKRGNPVTIEDMKAMEMRVRAGEA